MDTGWSPQTIQRSIVWAVAMIAPLAWGLVAVAAPLPGRPAASQDPIVQVTHSATLGDILVDSRGMTLYTFKNDTPDRSVCEDACAKRWPPLTVDAGVSPEAAQGIPGKLGVIQRKDSGLQVTYNDLPLYRYIGDTKAGETTGQGFRGLWFVVPGTAPAAAATSATKSW